MYTRFCCQSLVQFVLPEKFLAADHVELLQVGGFVDDVVSLVSGRRARRRRSSRVSGRVGEMRHGVGRRNLRQRRRRRSRRRCSDDSWVPLLLPDLLLLLRWCSTAAVNQRQRVGRSQGDDGGTPQSSQVNRGASHVARHTGTDTCETAPSVLLQLETRHGLADVQVAPDPGPGAFDGGSLLTDLLVVSEGRGVADARILRLAPVVV